MESSRASRARGRWSLHGAWRLATGSLALTLLFARETSAQGVVEVLRRPVGAPARVGAGEALAEVRAFALARTGARMLAAFVRAGQGRNRGALELAALGQDAAGALVRAGSDRVIAPSASAVGLAWDAQGGLLAWIAPRPHRNESERVRAARHRDGARSMQDSLGNPLGTPSLTAGDVMVQRLDPTGAPLGRPALIFSENARAHRVAVARDGQGWLLAWTGARTREGEVRGTVRAARISAEGALENRVIETDFSGPTGDGLRVLSAAEGAPARIAWSGERCREAPDRPAFAQPATDPSSTIETGPRFVIPQGPTHEHPGPVITCDPLSLYSAALRADGGLSPLVTGPALARDGLAIARGELLFSPRGADRTASLQRGALDAQGRLGAPRTLIASGPITPGLLASASAQPEADPSGASPSRVPPPGPPDPSQVLRAPAALDAAVAANGATVLAALSPTHRRVVLARWGERSDGRPSAVLAPVEPAYEVGLLGDPSGEPWLFVRVGIALGGPLVFGALDGPSAPAETAWVGDERLRVHLLRARAARASFTDFEHTFGPVSARADAASNPSMPGLLSSWRRLRARWSDACDGLQARARFLVRRGLDRDLETLARQQCELPAEPVPSAAATGSEAP
jgi:hypothetical protein